MQHLNLAECTEDQLGEYFAASGIALSHARRVLRAYHESAGQLDTSRLGLPRILREHLDSAPLMATRIDRRDVSSDGTQKLLIALADGARVESVLMPDVRPDRAAGCLSTQVGCPVGCDFCATGVQGLSRNLASGEIVEQFLHLKRLAHEAGRRLRTIVLMGMGEPLLNLANVLRAIHILAGNSTAQLGWRQITLSTVGLLPQLRQFVDARLNVQLAISLHAPEDDLRSRLIPLARRFPIAPILSLVREHQANTGRVTIIQYCLLDGVNDRDEHAIALADLLAGERMHVNLLPYNTTGRPFRASPPGRVGQFLALLRDRGVFSHVRRSRGSDIHAACGQLRTTAANIV